MVIIKRASEYGREYLTVDKKDLGKIQEKLEELYDSGKDAKSCSVDLEFEEMTCQNKDGKMVRKKVITLSYYPVEKRKLFG